MASNDLRLARYYATLDDIGIRDAVSLLHEEVQYAIILPNGVQRGTSRKDMQVYLESRPPVQRRHHLLRTAIDGDTEFIYGAVTDNDTVTGRFAAVALVDADGMIETYQVTFDLELVVVPAPELGA